ncbi:MAG: family ATPase [Solirubrobacterales bacterium]|nr:family ATPase [Solirubrobacterales bacterium]
MARQRCVVPGDAEEHETHASRVRLIGDRAYKRRKAIHFPFLDQSTADARRALALEELRLNQELAPDTYLGVRPVRDGDDGEWILGPRDEAAADGDLVVEMRRFQEADTLARRLEDGRIDVDDLRRLGARLARFHRDVPAVAGGGVREALARVHRNLEELAEMTGPDLEPCVLWRVTRPLTTYALANAEMLEDRAARGCWREGHGDLRADHVLLDDRGLRIVDRLEFDCGLRVEDVAGDLAFLLTDLEARGAGWAAREVLGAYRQAGGDAGDDRLLAFWSTYRASVSAKVAVLRARQPGGEAASAVAAQRLALAARLAWRTRRPAVLVVCGPPASGKSTLAGALHRRTGLPVVSSDVVRKELHGVAPTNRAPTETYSAAASVQVYRELGSRAAGALAFHGGVVVDATMGSGPLRAVFSEVLGPSPRTVFVQCQVPAPVAFERARAREDDPEAISDATAAVVARLGASWEPLDEVAAADHLLVRADRDPGPVLDELERWLDEVCP